jgi:hypothetical protein
VKGAGFHPEQRGLEMEEEGKTRTLENRKDAAPAVLFPQVLRAAVTDAKSERLPFMLQGKRVCPT